MHLGENCSWLWPCHRSSRGRVFPRSCGHHLDMGVTHPGLPPLKPNVCLCSAAHEISPPDPGSGMCVEATQTHLPDISLSGHRCKSGSFLPKKCPGPASPVCSSTCWMLCWLSSEQSWSPADIGWPISQAWRIYNFIALYLFLGVQLLPCCASLRIIGTCEISAGVKKQILGKVGSHTEPS